MKFKIPKIFILTLNWNGKNHLEYFIPSALSQNYKNYKIVVVDNGSTDNSVDFLKKTYPEIKLVCHDSNLGYSKGFNSGIKFCIENSADYILITNNDVVLQNKLLENLLECMQSHKRVGYVGGKVYMMGKTNILQYAGGRIDDGRGKLRSRGYNERDTNQYSTIEEFDYMDDVCGLVNTKMINEIGSYDEDFFYDYEETEWNYRMRKNNWRIFYTPKAKVSHRVHGSTGNSKLSPIPIEYGTKGEILFNFKTLNQGDFLYISLYFLLVQVPIRCVFLISKKSTFLIKHYFKGVVKGIIRIIEIKGENE